MIVAYNCEIYPSYPHYLPNLTENKTFPHIPRKGEVIPPPEWKERNYIHDILPQNGPHTKK